MTLTKIAMEGIIVPTEKVATIVIGGGLSSLYAACLLTGAKTSFVVLEARDCVGRRV